MISIKAPNFPLVVHLSTLFGFLIIATVAALIWTSYQRSKEVIAEHGQQLAGQAFSEVR